jgi:hypothetical protein
VYENRVLRRVFGPKRDEVTGLRLMGWYGNMAQGNEGQYGIKDGVVL